MAIVADFFGQARLKIAARGGLVRGLAVRVVRRPLERRKAASRTIAQLRLVHREQGLAVRRDTRSQRGIVRRVPAVDFIQKRLRPQGPVSDDDRASDSEAMPTNESNTRSSPSPTSQRICAMMRDPSIGPISPEIIFFALSTNFQSADRVIVPAYPPDFRAAWIAGFFDRRPIPTGRPE
jgi:hypothetical protein